MSSPAYAELHAHSAFTFLEGADQPAALVEQARDLGLTALAVLDVDGMYSAIQTAASARALGLPTVFGAELTLADGQFGLPERRIRGADDPGVRLPVLVRGPDAYHDLCGAMSAHALAHPGARHEPYALDELAGHPGAWVALTGTRHGPLRRALARRSDGEASALRVLDRLREVFGDGGVAVESTLPAAGDADLEDALADLAGARGLPLVATTAARCAAPASAPLADILAATRLRTSLAGAEPHLPALRPFLRSAGEMARLHRAHPEAVDNAAGVARACAFDLRLAAPGLPGFPVPAGHTEASWLRELAYRGARERYGTREEDPHAWDVIDRELRVIERLGFPGYFLIVHEIVDFCASRGILCQGRGSAANSAVCYALGITAVDAVRYHMLFERFLSPGRSGPPDIDLDIEADRREAVIQHVYELYGRDHAAQVANVVSYRPRSAIRDAARAFGYGVGQVKAWEVDRVREEEEGTARDEIPARVLRAATALQRLPRHMSIHPAGMVLTDTPVARVCPIAWGAMEGRSVLQWDKDDCADAGLVKFDLLGLGMLAALRRSFEWLARDGVAAPDGRPLALHTLPQEDPRVYDLLCAADTVGVFQVESRAQMNTLPRLRPREFYDIVVEVALIRPGPIQGQAVNPYIRRRRGREPVTYLHPLLEPALRRTEGVPLFQEQLMQIAVDVAGFSPAQADQLRRAIGSKRSAERMEALRPGLFAGMAARGVPQSVAQKVYAQLRGFADFGFPESHAFSFAYIVYASAWLKVHRPEYFYAGILASEPMGFYAPATLVDDARRHGVAVLAPDVNASRRLADVERVGAPGGARPSSSLVDPDPRLAVRLGLEQVQGIGGAAGRIVAARKSGGRFRSLADLARRARLDERDVLALARAGAARSLGVTRREALWGAGAVGRRDWDQPPLPGLEVGADAPPLAPLTPLEEMQDDYTATRLSTTRHPFELARARLAGRGILAASDLGGVRSGQVVSVAGMVTHRQRPHTARGTTFLSLEDETGLVNVVCARGLWARYRRVAVGARALVVRGRLERGDGAVAVQAMSLEELPVPVSVRSRDFR